MFLLAISSKHVYHQQLTEEPEESIFVLWQKKKKNRMQYIYNNSKYIVMSLNLIEADIYQSFRIADILSAS